MAPISFLKPKNKLEEGGRAAAPVQEDQMEPEKTCPNCRKPVPLSRLWANGMTCSCGYHFRMKARQRIALIADKGSFNEMFAHLKAGNPLDFPGYAEKLETVRTVSEETEAVLCGTASIGGRECCLFVMEPYFMMGSMGSVVGEKITRLFEHATEHRLPVVGFTVSGGARMQEGLLSLMQMAKTSAAVKNHGDAGLLYIALLTDPTTGGVTASFAMEADIILAEPGATIGFAGPRVIEQTTHKALPKRFQAAEAVMRRGFIDRIVHRGEQRDLLAKLIGMHDGRGGMRKRLPSGDSDSGGAPSRAGAPEAPRRSQDDGIRGLFRKVSEGASAPRNPYDRVRLARDNARPTGLDYITHVLDGFVELHGDRRFADDPAIVGGIALLDGMPTTVIAVEKGHTAKERSLRNLGAPNPEGYRKALRLMKQAEKFGRPVVCFVDTSGAYCGPGAEERGQGQAIAESLMEMSTLCVPTISLLVGEGGSGGALALAVADRVWMLQNATYSVISPEGCASILWRDARKAEDAAASLKLTADDAMALGVIERILPEGDLGEEGFYQRIRSLIGSELRELAADPDLLGKRYQRFRRIGTDVIGDRA